MPLTAIEQNKIFKKEIGPQNIDILTLTFGIAIQEGVDFVQNYKDSAFETDQNGQPVRPNALNYVTKLQSIIRSLQRADSGLIKQFTRVAIARIGEDFTFNQVQNASDEQWQTHIKTRMIRILEIFAGCLRSEVLDYMQAPNNGA